MRSICRVLCDRDIHRELMFGHLEIEPRPEPRQMQPVSIDLRLGEGYCAYPRLATPVPISDIPTGLVAVHPYPPGGLTLHPGEFVLATTAERVRLPDNLVGYLHGKSTLGRLGLMIHSTAGLIDPGFNGKITLEVANVGHLMLVLRPGDLIAQLTLDYTSGPVQRPYGSDGLGSHYQGQQGTTGPRSGEQAA